MIEKRLFIKILTALILILTCFTYIVPSFTYATEVKQEVKNGINNFPKGYRIKLEELSKLHPNWSFTAYYTGIEWNELIRNESFETMHEKNVVPAYSDPEWKCAECPDKRGWHCASKTAIEYFIDPRNFLDEVRVFQFEELSYNEKVHTLESVKKSVKGTFLENSVTYYDETQKKNITKSYSEIIIEAAKQTNISPFHIKSKIIQEVGSKGSDSVSGTYKGYEGLYNFFNYGAHDSGNPIENGLSYARDRGWTNPYIAIIEGAKLIGNSYINVGQNTSYFFKFDVVGNSILKTGETGTVDYNNMFWHQYMTNLMDPYSQSPAVYNMYAANGNLEANLNFIIPIYNNMPNEPEEEPEVEEEIIKFEIDTKGKTIKVIPDATIEDVLSEAKITNYTITDANGKVISKDKEIFATGYKLNVLDKDKKTITNTYTIIKIGDVDGNGKVNTSDAIKILKNYVELEKLSGVYLKAADTTKDTKQNTQDALRILKFYVDMEKISI